MLPPASSPKALPKTTSLPRSYFFNFKGLPCCHAKDYSCQDLYRRHCHTMILLCLKNSGLCRQVCIAPLAKSMIISPRNSSAENNFISSRKSILLAHRTGTKCSAYCCWQVSCSSCSSASYKRHLVVFYRYYSELNWFIYLSTHMHMNILTHI